MLTDCLKPFALSLSLLMAAGGLLVNTAAAESDQLVASVDNVPIRLSYVYRHIEALPLGDQIDVRDQLDRFTESVINEELLFQYALKQLEGDADFREAIKTQVLSQLIERQVKSLINISDEAVSTYYEDNSGDDRAEHWRVHHMPLNTSAQCEALMPRITSLALFVDLASKHSTDPVLANRGGDMGYIMRQHNVLGFGEDLFTMPLHQAHRIDNRDGCHLIWISDYKKLAMPTLDEVRDQIHQSLVRQQEVSLLKKLLKKASKDIVVKRYLPTNNTAQEAVSTEVLTSNRQN